ncbi:MAG: hypothetical protein ACOY0T_37565 [Myxococcota bacterium]
MPQKFKVLRRALTLSLLLSTGASTTLAGCSQTNESQSGSVAITAQPVTAESETARVGESATSPALAVSWNVTQPEEHGATLKAILRNTTQEAIHAELTLVGTTPAGDVVSRPVGTRSVRAGETVAVEYSVAILPAQSEGLASTVALYAAYTSAGAQFAPGMAAQPRKVQVIGPTLHVTLDQGTNLATFRSAAAQAKFNSSVPGDAATRLRRVSVYDRASNSMLDATQRSIGARREIGRPLTQTSLGPPGMRTPPTVKNTSNQGQTP